MTIIDKIYKEYLIVKSDSQILSDKIHNEFIDRAFCVNNKHVYLSIFTTIVMYGVLNMFEHDKYLHIWFYASMIYLAFRWVLTYCYGHNKNIFSMAPLQQLTQRDLILLGGLVGGLWLFLTGSVMMWGEYALESKIIVGGFLFLYTFGCMSIYCMLPFWWISYAVILFVPIVLSLFFYGYFGALCGAILLCYVGFVSAITYRNYKVFFQSFYLQYKNEEYVCNIDKYSRNLEKLNEALKENNDELRGEIRRRKLAEQKIKKLASTDTLTGVTNRVTLDEKMTKVLRYANRTKTNVGIMFIDFDEFKLINDNFGHHVGDELLRSVVNRLSGCVRETDEIFRVGGDEFIILITNIEREESLIPVATNILYVLEQPHLIEEKSIISRVSMGISIYPNNGLDPEDLLKYADKAMYKSKQCGGNTYTFYSN